MTTKRFARLQFLFVIMLTLTLICSTYSWASRPKVTGGAFMSEKNTDGNAEYNKDKTYFTAMKFDTSETPYYINGVECTAKTYRGTMDENGKITYGTEEISGVQETLSANAPIYFRTEITNPSPVPTNVSLFITGKLNQNIQSSFSFGITSPIAYSGIFDVGNNTPDNQHFIAYDFNTVLAQYEIDPGGTANIEWYVINNNQDGTAGAFQLNEIVLTNN